MTTLRSGGKEEEKRRKYYRRVAFRRSLEFPGNAACVCHVCVRVLCVCRNKKGDTFRYRKLVSLSSGRVNYAVRWYRADVPAYRRSVSRYPHWKRGFHLGTDRIEIQYASSRRIPASSLNGRESNNSSHRPLPIPAHKSKINDWIRPRGGSRGGLSRSI